MIKMRENIELIRLLFPDANLIKKTESTETYQYKEDAYILEIDIKGEIGESRIILKGETVHKEEFGSKFLLGHLPYLRGLAMGKVIEVAYIDEGIDINNLTSE